MIFDDDTLERAFKVASRLSEVEQDHLASQLLEELQADDQWNPKFAATAGGLAALAAEALAEQRAGKTELMSDLDV